MEAAHATPPSPSGLRVLWRWATGESARGWRVPPLLALLLAIALALRLYGISWDQGHFFHPDERSIYMRVDCMYRVLTTSPGYGDCTRDAPFQQTKPGFPSPPVFLDADRSPLNPHWFPLGSLAMYLLLGVKLALAPILTMDLQDLALAGRSLAALADVATIAMAYALGKRIYGRGAGLLAAAFITFAVVHIQIAHFYRPEPFHNLFLLCSFWQMLNVLERRRLRHSAALGLFVGLTFATKASALPLLLPVAAVYVYLLLRLPKVGAQGLAPLHNTPSPLTGEGTDSQHAQSMEGLAFRGLLTGLVAVAVYLVTTPYALLSFPEFLEWNLRELDIVRRAGIVPYTLQYVGAPKVAYEVQQTVVWGLGIPLGLLAWGGFLATLALNLWRPRLPQALLLLWAVPLLFTVTGVQVKFLRYTFPLMPVFIIMGAGVAVQAIGWAGKRWRLLGRALAVAVGLAVAATVFYGLAFMSVYSRDHTAVQASQWIRANVPAGTEVLTDNHWDEGIPDLYPYEITQLPMFEGDSVQKMEAVAQKLARAETLVFYSNRTYGAIARAPDRYPYSSAYYNALFRGDLGYELAASFSSYPTLMGIAFADDPFTRAGVPAPTGLTQPAPLTLRLGYADNDAITYDHPLVLVFRNTARYDSRQLLQRLIQASPVERVGAETALLLTDQEREAQQTGGTWRTIYNPNSIANHLPILAWLLLVEAASLAVWPLAYLLFRGLHDRGYLLTKALAILLLAYLPWALAALKILPYERWTIYLGLLTLTAVSALVVARKREEIGAFLRERWRGLALQEALFLAAFLAFVAIRWANPDLWHSYRGGEKPMDFAYLNAVVRSTTVPPYDPWFAGGYLNYYYFGQFIVATLIKATGILPEVAYNLAIPLLFALTVGGAFSVAYNLAHGLRNTRTESRQVGTAWGPAAAGIAAALFVAVLGNTGSAIQLVINAWSAAHGSGFPHFDFWSPSRMMPGQISITEFPFWTFLFADLHAHLIAIPFSLLAIGLALNVIGIGTLMRKTSPSPSPLEGERGGEGELLPAAKGDRRVKWSQSSGLPSLALPLGFLALAVGSLAAINTWDYPTYLLLGASAVFLGCYGLRGRTDRGMLGLALLWAALFAALSYALFLPYHVRNSAPGLGAHSSLQQTEFLHYSAIHAIFLFIVASYLVYEARGYIKGALLPLRRLGPRHAQATVDQAPAMASYRPLAWGMSVILVIAVAYVLLAGYGTTAFLFALLAVAVVLAMRYLARGAEDAPHLVFLLVLLAGALGIGIGIDLVTVEPDIDRMNTGFKFYLEAWTLFGVASAVMLWRLMTLPLTFSGATVLKGLWLSALGLLILAAAVFPVLGTRARFADRFSTEFQGLNGTQFMQNATYYDDIDDNGPLPARPIELRWDWDGIQWLRANVQGSPVVAEGNTDPHNYRWGSRVSIYTGLPAIIGWGWHQTQQRVGQEEQVRQRLEDTRRLYSTANKGVALDIMKQYNVRYVYVGQLERLYYPEEGLAKFDGMADQRVTLAYQNPQVKIYLVR